MEPLDLALRAMAALQLIYLASLLLLRRPFTARAALLPLGVAAYMVTSAPGADALPYGLLFPLTLMCVANPVWFWLLGEALFTDDAFVERRWLMSAAVIVVAGVWHEIGPPGPHGWLAGTVFHLGAVGVVGATVWQVLRGKRSDLVEPRRRWRSWFVVGIGAYGMLAVAMLIQHGGQLPPGLARANITFVLACSVVISLWLATRADAAASPATQDEPQPARAREAPAIDTALVARIGEAMQVDRLYRRESLTVAELARSIGSQEYLVRRAINRYLGHRNFNEFLHGYRLGEAAARLLSQPELPILSIALDVGYGSIGPFNRAFRARFGMTPTEYRATQTEGTRDGAHRLV